jgi:hypothetical protein
MTQAQTYSWIFYAIALASQQEPADYAGIETVADGINHAVPTQKEMRKSLSWLAAQNLVKKEGKRYRLTETGKILADDASAGTTMKVWKNLESRLSQLGANNHEQLNPRTMDT